ncbi:MAG TPA: glutathione S-transferase C-terminal domain-containing protein [Rhodanobacteraceae bacterium]|nr:glutathione S-transferase C-terminal domain-containing protein [Rhodanobacteraceae bacterium]
MIDLYYWPTPNGHKITLFLEEAGLPYTIKPVNIGKGDQFKPDYLAISPNNKMPAMVDHNPADGGVPISVFESGAILTYLAVKTGKFAPADLRGRVACLEWLFWQMGGLGPMTGQHGHFSVYAPEKIPYAMERYRKESERLLDVLDRRLAGRAFITGDDYTIADMACYPWISPYDKAPLDLAPFAEVRRWREAIAARPATARAYARDAEVNPKSSAPMGADEKKILFGQGARKG